MNNIKQVVIVGVIALVVALGVNYFGTPKSYPTPTTKAELAELVTLIAKEFKVNYGSVVSTDTLQGDRFCFNGVCKKALHNTLTASWAGTEGTTTACSFRAATTSLLTSAVAVIRGNATATFFGWGTGLNSTATDTISIIGSTGLSTIGVDTYAIASTSITLNTGGGQATTTVSAAIDRVILAGQYVNLKVAGGTGGTLRPTGSCDIELLELTGL